MIDQPKTQRITIRLSDENFLYLKAVAYMAGMSVSEYMRVLAQSSITAAKVQEQKGVWKLEDFKTILDN